MTEPWELYRASPSHAAASPAEPWELYAGKATPTVAEDLAKTAPTLPARAVAAWLGGPSAIATGLVGAPAQFLEQKLSGLNDEQYAAKVAERRRNSLLGGERDILDKTSPQGLTQALEEKVTGPLYRPQTAAGQYAVTGAEFAPAMLAGPGGLARRFLAAEVPAVASETAGQLTQGSAAEPYARMGGAILGGTGVAVAQAPRGARAVTSEALRASGVNEGHLADAYTLMREAETGGVRLTLDEALNQVTGGQATRLSQLRRVAENSGGEGARPLAEIAAQRPAQVEALGRGQIGTIAPNPIPPAQAAQAGQEAAQGAIRDLRQRGQERVGPFYQRAAQDVVPAEEIEGALARIDNMIANEPNPAITRGLQDLRAQLVEQPGTPGTPGTPAARTPVMGPNGQVIRYETTPAVPPVPPTPEVPRTNVGELDRVYRSNRDIHTGPPVVGETGVDRATRRATIQGLEEINAPLLGASDDLAAGRGIAARWAQRTVTPAEQGPLGKIAETDPGTANASPKMGAILAGANETSGRYEPVIQQAVRRMVREDPRAAETLARDYIGDVFNKAIGDLKTGADQYGGAGFRSALAGDPATMANLRAMVTQLPNGQQRWAGFNRFLDVMEATGYKPVKGSDTAFNQAIQKELRTSTGPVGTAIEQASKGGLGIKQAISDRWERYRLGQNTEELARMLTDPAHAPLLRQLAQAPAGSARAQAIAARLTFLATQGAASSPNP